jgi:hypothetical protein
VELRHEQGLLRPEREQEQVLRPQEQVQAQQQVQPLEPGQVQLPAQELPGLRLHL